MKFVLVMLAASVALLSGCVVAPYGDEHHGDHAYYDRDHGDHGGHEDRGDRDRGDHRDYGGDHDRGDRHDQY